MKQLRLALRSPSGLLVDQPVQSIVAEDLDGWFGIRPGRADLIAALPPGLLMFRDAEGECFVALASGLLDLSDGVCRVAAREVVMSRNLERIAGEVEKRVARRQLRAQAQRGALFELLREALTRLAGEARA